MRSFSLEKFRNKVGRRSSEPSLLDSQISNSSDRRNSILNPVIMISDAEALKTRAAHSRLRASSISHAATNTRSRSRSVSKKQAKELIRQETSQVILKKLATVLGELGVQLPVPLRTTSGSGGPLKSMKVYVSNTNDCIYLAPASSASFTYEDVENGGYDIPETDEQNGNWFAQNENGSDTASEVLGLSLTDTEDTEHEPRPERLHSKIASFKLPNYLCTQIDSELPVPHLFAVILDLKKECQVKHVRIEFSSLVSTLWPTGDTHSRYNVKEKFKIGSLEWIVSLHDADYFISTSNSNDTRSSDVTPRELAERTRKYRLVDVQLLATGSDDVNLGRKNPVYLAEFLQQAQLDVTSITSGGGGHDVFDAGIYVFLVPILIPPHIPASVTSINGSLNHRLSVNVHKISDKLNRKTTVNSNFNLPMVRTPPSLANSVADKPIYVNRVWNDSLHYVITFPRKYVSLGSEHTVNVKLVPLVKDVIIKRIKFNVLERITYISRDLSREYEYDGDDPFLTRNPASLKTRERVVSLCELKTKHKNSYQTNADPYKEEVIKCPDNNILFSCYEPGQTKELSVMIASPLDINIALPFLTTRADKELVSSNSDQPGDLDLRKSFSNPSRSSFVSQSQSARRDSGGPLCPSSPVIGLLETHISHMNRDQLMNGELDEDVFALDSSAMLSDDSGRSENISKGYTSTGRALAPDSNFRHIQISHRLQVCFRISKPDPADNYRMHHYEVVVDTPLVLLSAKCNDESIQLPEYNEIDSQSPPPPTQRGISFRMPSYNKGGVSIKRLDEYGDEQLPSFEEALSANASPIMRSVLLGEDQISRMNSLTPSEPAPAYECNEDMVSPLSIDDLVIDPSPVAAPRRQSGIKSSLVSSFAPYTNSMSRSDNNTLSTNSSSSKSVMSEVPNAEDNSSGAPTDNGSSGAPPSIQSLLSMSSDAVSIATPIETLVGPLDGPLDNSSSELPQSFDGDVIAPLREDLESVQYNSRNMADETESVITQESQFVQTLPLLQNASVDNVENETCYASTGQNHTKLLTDTLDGEFQSQDMFHAY